MFYENLTWFMVLGIGVLVARRLWRAAHPPIPASVSSPPRKTPRPVVYDVAYRSGSLWASLPPVHAFAGLMVVAMSSVVIVSLIYRTSPKTPYRFNWDGVALLVMYGFAMVMLYIMA